MPISKELLDEFRELYKKEFDDPLTNQEVLDKAMGVLKAFKAVYRPIPRAKKEKYRKLREEYGEYGTDI